MGHVSQIYANGFHYSDKCVMDRLRLGNGLWEGGTINSRYQPTQITLGTSSGGSELLKLDYNYGSNGNNGNVLSQTITVPTIGTATGFVTTQAYTYDALNRLATVAETQYGQSTPDWQLGATKQLRRRPFRSTLRSCKFSLYGLLAP
jgi:hypothetical protein